MAKTHGKQQQAMLHELEKQDTSYRAWMPGFATTDETMRGILGAFVLGTLLVHGLPAIPGDGAVGICGLLAGLAAIGRRPRLAACLLGLGWSLWHVQQGLAARLPAALDDEVFVVSGRITDLPETGPRQVRFLFEFEPSRPGERKLAGPRRAALAAYGDAPALPAGSRCTLHVRLRQPRASVNPGTFDRERWFFATGVDAVGQLIAHPGNRCEPAPQGSLLALRASIARAIHREIATPSTAGFLAALAVGERAGIGDTQWQVLQATGTTHVVSISGLHVSMVAFAVAALVAQGVALWPALAARVPAPHLGLVCGWLAAAGYTALAGATAPTVRSLVMLGCFFRRRMQGHVLLDTDGLLYAAALVLVFDPLASLTASAWLTFGAVAVLGAVTASLHGGWRWLRLHGWLAVMLAPLAALVVPNLALSSPLANALLVPIITWGVVPLVLVGIALQAFCPDCGHWPWQAAAALWEYVWTALEAFASFVPVWWLPQAPGLLAGAVLTAGLGLWRLPFGRWRRQLGTGLVAGALAIPPARPALHTFNLAVLDVGQGTAAVIETARHVLVFDTGPRTFGGIDAGRTVLVPYLRHRGWSRLDRVVVSHADSDHAGGLQSVRAAFEPGVLLLSPAHAWQGPVGRCVAGSQWHWDGVDFRFLAPLPGEQPDRNDQSCVLEVSTGDTRVLLAGDIEAPAEARLVTSGTLRSVSLLLAPHHGSATSSSPGFVAALAPRHVVFSRGHRNHFGMPAPAVLARYRQAGALAHDTALDGAIEFRVAPARITWRDARRSPACYWRVDGGARLPTSWRLW